MQKRVPLRLSVIWVLVGCLSAFEMQANASMFLAGVSGGGFTSVNPGPDSTASDTFSSNTTGSGSSSASAFSDGGVLGGIVTASSTGTAVSFNTNAAAFKSYALIDDLIISGPGATATVQVSVNIHGFIQLSGLNETDATAGLRADLRIFKPLSTSSNLALYQPGTFGSGTDIEIDTSLTTVAVTLPTNTNLSIEMNLWGRVVASDNFGPGSANASLNFLNTMSFPTVGPVFILPDGFTANSVSGNIVNNRFVGETATVPEPATFWMFGSGLLGLFGLSRKRKLNFANSLEC